MQGSVVTKTKAEATSLHEEATITQMVSLQAVLATRAVNTAASTRHIQHNEEATTGSKMATGQEADNLTHQMQDEEGSRT